MIIFVRDRHFNDYRYNITSDKLKSLGWKEEISFDDGLKMTLDWYMQHGDRFGNMENILKAHPDF